ncbi:MAG: hypothetical protein JXB15_09130 [Anaerolineales bacterium]|nr:hypothetical protein [Anaerolineales bacterium]
MVLASKGSMDQEASEPAPETSEPEPSSLKSGLPFVALQGLGLGLGLEQPVCPLPPRAGDLCPQCHSGRLDYDGLLNLVCPLCGYTAGGAGCT